MTSRKVKKKSRSSRKQIKIITMDCCSTQLVNHGHADKHNIQQYF